MNEPPLYPLFLQLRDLPVLIVGGGPVAARKAAALLDSRARITVISPEILPSLAGNKKITSRRSVYASAHMTQKPWRLVFAATSSRSVNVQIARDARAARILCCRCDHPDRGDFICGSVAHRPPITLALSTSGASPTLATRLRDQAMAALDPALLKLAELQKAWRKQIKQEMPTLAARSALLKRLAGEEMESHLRARGPKAAERRFAQWLAAAQKRATHAR